MLLGALAVVDAVVDTVELDETTAVPLLVADVEPPPPKILETSELTRDVALAMIPDPVPVLVTVLLAEPVAVLVAFGFGTVAAKIVALYTESVLAAPQDSSEAPRHAEVQ